MTEPDHTILSNLPFPHKYPQGVKIKKYKSRIKLLAAAYQGEESLQFEPVMLTFCYYKTQNTQNITE